MIVPRSGPRRLEVEGLFVRHPGASRDCLQALDLTIAADRPLFVLGPDGAGKSTLLAALAGLVPERSGGSARGVRRLLAADGTILELGGPSLSPSATRSAGTRSPSGAGVAAAGAGAASDGGAWLERSALVLDDPIAQLSGARSSVEEELALALEYRGMARHDMRRIVESALEEAGIGHLRDRDPLSLSMGEAARLAWAAACVARPDLVLLDEPTAHLDASGSAHVRERILALHRDDGALVAVATHAVDWLESLVATSGRGSGADRDVGAAAVAAPSAVTSAAAAGAVGASGTARGLDPRALVLAAGRTALHDPFRSVMAALRPAEHGVAPSTLATAQRVAAGEGAVALAGSWGTGHGVARPERAALPSTAGLVRELGPARVRVCGISTEHADGTAALHGIDLELEPGRITALIGANGAGKSSLARTLAGLVPVAAGRLTIRDADVTRALAPRRAELVGLAFQRPEDQIFERSVEREVAFGPRCLGLRGEALAGAVGRALELCGLAGARAVHPYDLTRAGRRWVGLAATLALETPVVVLDEPTVGLDHAGIDRLKTVLDGLAAAGRSLLVISHDLDFVGEVAGAVAVMMAGGRILAAGGPRAVLGDPGLLGRAGLEPAAALSIGRDLGLIGEDSAPPLCRAALAAAIEARRGR